MEDTKKTLTLNTTKITNHYMITRTTIANKLQCFGKGLRTIRASIGSGEKGEGRTTRACGQAPTVWYRDGDNLGQRFGAYNGQESGRVGTSPQHSARREDHARCVLITIRRESVSPSLNRESRPESVEFMEGGED